MSTNAAGGDGQIIIETPGGQPQSVVINPQPQQQQPVPQPRELPDNPCKNLDVITCSNKQKIMQCCWLGEKCDKYEAEDCGPQMNMNSLNTQMNINSSPANTGVSVENGSIPGFVTPINGANTENEVTPVSITPLQPANFTPLQPTNFNPNPGSNILMPNSAQNNQENPCKSQFTQQDCESYNIGGAKCCW